MGDIVTNRKARRDFHVSDTIEAGIELRGSEIKSIRKGRINLNESFARVHKGEIWLYNCDIAHYEQSSHEIHVPLRNRRLLLHKKEIRRLKILTDQKGENLFPLSMYWKNGKIKVKIGIGKSKNQRDKREDLKQKAHNREVERELNKINKY